MMLTRFVRVVLLAVASLALGFAQQPDVTGVFSGPRPHVPNPANPAAVTAFQPSDKAAPAVVLDPKDFAGVVARVDATLRRYMAWGLNPKGLTLDNFDVEFVVVKGQAAGSVSVPDRDYLKVTYQPPAGPRVSEEFDVSLIAKYGAYPTAREILSLPERKAE